MIEGFTQMAAGLRLIAEEVETNQASHAEVAAALRLIADQYDEMAR
jgi:hypothetical protein